jgi:hypothetical protein
MHEIRSLRVGTGERSYYPALQTLLNDIGEQRRPRVLCVQELADQGAGHPDFGLYSAGQLQARSAEPRPGALPERGVIEAKPPHVEVQTIASSRQVVDYWNRYGLVLVTNFRAFQIVGRDQFGHMVRLEEFTLADSDAAFWTLAAQPARLSDALDTRFTEFLIRALLHNATLSQPRDVAWFLASFARDALARLEGSDPDLHSTQARLEAVRNSLEEALGITFDDAKGLHFFYSTLVQTLFYGLFSAWVLWCRQHADPEARKGFSAMGAAWHLRLPVLRGLFEAVNTPSALEPLKLDEVLEWAAATLRRVDDTAFFARFQQDSAVQYFYEPFLEAFDPELRRQLGVWYTPPEVVDYMVERVDQVVRSELGIARGLADERVVVLDPCCGTGSYLVSVLNRIARTLREEGDDALVGSLVKEAAIRRVHGFEILPAPFVVAHLQLALMLEALGAPLGEEGPATWQRAEWPSIRLTNALTGWNADDDRTSYLALPDLQNEMDAARKVKRDDEILVVIGNPPYNGFAGIAESDEERALTEAYKQVRRVRPPEGPGLNDPYDRFFRIAERRIAEQTGRGVVCFITNDSWIEAASYTGMRERYLEVFDRIWIDCLNGDKFKTGKVTPDGQPDPSIFSTERNREGIKIGTAVSLLVRCEERTREDRIRGVAEIEFRHFWGRNKREELRVVTAGGDGPIYEPVRPTLDLGLLMMPGTSAEGYFEWPSLVELMPTSFPGVKTSRDDFLIAIDRDKLVERLHVYFDRGLSNGTVRERYPEIMTDGGRFNAEAIRSQLTTRGLLPDHIVKYCYRPFDVRWIYWEPETKLLDEKRTEYQTNLFETNIWLSSGKRNRKEGFYQPQVTKNLADHHIVESNVALFPLFLRDGFSSTATFGQGHIEASQVGEVALASTEAIRSPAITRANLSRSAIVLLRAIDGKPADLFHHALSIFHAPAYRRQNAAALRQDWPRLPIPRDAGLFRQSSMLGAMLAELLDSEAAVPKVTSDPRPELRMLGTLRRLGASPLDLGLTARWGYAGQKNTTMPGRGDARERVYTDEELAVFTTAASVQGLLRDDLTALLGETTYDIFLNDTAYWSNVPARVWDYTIGGYQVIKKWLSYREQVLLERPLKPEEARYVTEMVRRIAALLLLEPALDDNYRAVAAAARNWTA